MSKSAQTCRNILYLGARLLFVVFFLMTSSYCLLAYVPFTYQWVINCTLVGMQQELTTNLKSVAFTTDITPTLYYLLGRRPIARNPIFGRPLITTTAKEHDEYLQKSYLVVSSYGPVYGILGDEGRSLFLADAVNRTSYFFNLAEDPKATRNRLTPPIQSDNEKLIRDTVESINKFYQVGNNR